MVWEATEVPVALQVLVDSEELAVLVDSEELAVLVALELSVVSEVSEVLLAERSSVSRVADSHHHHAR